LLAAGQTSGIWVMSDRSGGRLNTSTWYRSARETACHVNVGGAVTGVPFAGLLTAAIVLLTIAQIGPLPVLLPAVAWLYWTDNVSLAGVLLVWTVVVAGIDNVIRPFLIRKGADLPLLLIFAGVIGGMFGFGIIGIFIGPVILAVSYTLLLDWMNSERVRDLP